MKRSKNTYDKYLWLRKFEEVTEANDGFAVNYSNDKDGWISNFKKLQKLGARISIVDYETIRIMWPRMQHQTIDVLRYLYTEMPYPSSADKLKNNEGLEICWS
ncbi:MAG TPA: hypothetical protein VMX17_12010 [Candidatus Glassbacteria bacterium]|nr:hypothetical protein [Candidatus Glassbacteria bacterium]